jgi:UDPglucose--hexose-1-phosphate uridylyltransferase
MAGPGRGGSPGLDPAPLVGPYSMTAGEGNAAKRERPDATPLPNLPHKGGGDLRLDLGEASHRRLNPLTGEWTLVSPHRMKRPWQGKREAVAAAPAMAHDPNCYLCPGNVRANGARNPSYAHTFVFDNDFAALQPDAPPDRVEDGLLIAESESGLCRVLCFSPRHDLTLAQMDVADVERVVDAWVEETINLGSLPDVTSVQIFENRGEIMGCSNPHPHGQIWATRHLPNELEKETHRQTEHLLQFGRPLLVDYLAQELALNERVVFANDDFCVLVPFWAIWPFETMILPRRPIHGFDLMSARERRSLAEALSDVTRRYDRLFEVSFPYSMGFHQRPTDGAVHAEWQMHAHFYPPLLRSATVKKFMVGFEMLASPQRDLTPEAAAARLRDAAA